MHNCMWPQNKHILYLYVFIFYVVSVVQITESIMLIAFQVQYRKFKLLQIYIKSEIEHMPPNILKKNIKTFKKVARCPWFHTYQSHCHIIRMRQNNPVSSYLTHCNTDTQALACFHWT